VKVTDLSNKISTKLYEHESPIISFDFCKIKQLLASFCSENMMIIYSLERKNSLKFSTETKIWCLRFTLNGLYLMAGDHEGNLTLYETSKFENYKIETNNAQNYQFKVFQLHESRIKDIVESFDGKFVATASFDMSVCVFQLEKVEEKKSFNHHEDWVRGLSFGPHHIYSCGDDRKILGFEIQEEKVKTSENNSKFFWLIVFIVVLLLMK
jgi:WD40 repeat protein